MTLISSIYILDGCPLFAYLCINLFVEIAMTKDGIIQDVNAKTRVLMKNDFNRQQAEALFGFVHEQIKEYCHTKVDQRIFEKKLFERLDQLASKDELKLLEVKMFETFSTKDDLKQLETKMFDTFATKDDLKQLENKMFDTFSTKDDLKKLEVKMFETFATKEDLKQFATKEDLKQFATKEDFRFLQEQINELRQAINELTLMVRELTQVIKK